MCNRLKICKTAAYRTSKIKHDKHYCYLSWAVTALWGITGSLHVCRWDSSVAGTLRAEVWLREPKHSGWFHYSLGSANKCLGPARIASPQTRNAANKLTAKLLPDLLPHTWLSIYLPAKDQKETVLPSSVTTDIPDTVWVHRSDCFDTDNVRKMGSNEIPWGFRAAAIIGDMTEQQAHPSWFACSTSHCGLGAELVANAFPVTIFPCVIWTEFVCSPCLFFSFVHIAGILKAAMHKQNHVMRGFCWRRGADVSQHTTACAPQLDIV